MLSKIESPVIGDFISESSFLWVLAISPTKNITVPNKIQTTTIPNHELCVSKLKTFAMVTITESSSEKTRINHNNFSLIEVFSINASASLFAELIPLVQFAF